MRVSKIPIIAKSGWVKVVVITINKAPQMANTGGRGYHGILYGRKRLGSLLRKIRTPTNNKIEKIHET